MKINPLETTIEMRRYFFNFIVNFINLTLDGFRIPQKIEGSQTKVCNPSILLVSPVGIEPTT